MVVRLVVLGLLLALAPAAGAAARIPEGWPAHLTLGLRSGEREAGALKRDAPFGARYLYLSGGVRTGRNWQDWGMGGGAYVSDYIEDSAAHGTHPVFSYYMALESEPARSRGGEEAARFMANLRDAATMRAYMADLRTFFARAGATGRAATLHVEPDMWGYAQTRARNDDARTVPVAMPGAGEDTLAGLAQEIVRLRDALAPRVTLGYHLSIWGTGHDISRSDPPDATVDALAARAARFYRSLDADFDLVFFEFADRDAGYRVALDGDRGDAWWDAEDFRRHTRFIGGALNAIGRPGVVWQIPVGNSRLPDVHGRYRDNRVEWLLDPADGYAHLRAYRDAGVIGLLFGHALGGATCACDQLADGADDDGGVLKRAARAYYAAGPAPLLAGRVARQRPPRPEPRATGSWRSRAVVRRAGRRLTVTATFSSTVTRRVLLAVEVHAPGGRPRLAQRSFDKLLVRAGRRTRVTATFTLPPRLRGRPVIRLGAFNPGWGRLLHWNGAAG